MKDAIFGLQLIALVFKKLARFFFEFDVVLNMIDGRQQIDVTAAIVCIVRRVATLLRPSSNHVVPTR